jgi:hypothetical protein
MASEFQSICDDLGHGTLTVEDAKALIQPAWFLGQQALQDFTALSGLPGAVKDQLTVIVDALELNLATIADKKPTAVLDFYQFKDVCHLAQLTWIITAPLTGSDTLTTARDALADASVQVKARMAQAASAPIATKTVLLWTSAIGFGIYLVRRLRRKQMEM